MDNPITRRQNAVFSQSQKNKDWRNFWKFKLNLKEGLDEEGFDEQGLDEEGFD